MIESVITHGVRTPIGKIGGALKDVSAERLLAHVIKNLIGVRAQLNLNDIDQVIMGQVKQSSASSNIARSAALLAKLDENTPAYTVHRQCGSGLQSIINADQMIRCAYADVAVAGGAENMSQSPYFLRHVRAGLGNGGCIIEDSLVAGGPGAIPVQRYGNQPMGITAENLAERYKISREEQDAFAMASQQKADKAIRQGRFQTQILPVETPGNIFDTDEYPFLSSMEKLAALQPSFKKNGSVTAGNSSGRNDGAAAVLVMSREACRRMGYRPMARILAAASSGCDPLVMGLGPVACTKKALKQAGLTLKDMDVIELNEAFAAQAIAVIREWEAWGISREQLMKKINPNGGAIALGHPLAATGAVLTVKCMYELHRRPQSRYGLITLCCGGGLGVALILEKTEGGRK